MNEALTMMQLDSIYQKNKAILFELEKAEADISKTKSTSETPVPDASVNELAKFKAVGGPILNATYLTKYLAPDFETLLVVGEKEDHELHCLGTSTLFISNTI